MEARLGSLWAIQRGVGVGGREDSRGHTRPLPEDRQVEAEKLADTTQRVLDLAVDLGRPQVDEPGGDVGDQRLELEEGPEVFGGARRLIERGHSG